jgi:hypothetical protein
MPWRIFGAVSSVKTAMSWAAVVSAGIAAGLWMASMTYSCELCVFAPSRFAAWQCCVVGFVVSAMAFWAIRVIEREFLPTSLDGIRRVRRFLFEDLAQRQGN